MVFTELLYTFIQAECLTEMNNVNTHNSVSKNGRCSDSKINISEPKWPFVPVKFCYVVLRIDRARFRLKIAGHEFYIKLDGRAGGRKGKTTGMPGRNVDGKGRKEAKNASATRFGDRNRKIPIRRIGQRDGRGNRPSGTDIRRRA